MPFLALGLGPGRYYAVSSSVLGGDNKCVSLSAKPVRDAVMRPLKRLRVDYLDLYFLVIGPDIVPRLKRLRAAPCITDSGKVRSCIWDSEWSAQNKLNSKHTLFARQEHLTAHQWSKPQYTFIACRDKVDGELNPLRTSSLDGHHHLVASGPAVC